MIPPARAILAAGALVLLAGAAPAADMRTVTDSAGRHADVPGRVERVYAAGGLASIFLYTLAPEKMLGWTRALGSEERAFVPARYAALPTLGRLTGRGNTAPSSRPSWSWTSPPRASTSATRCACSARSSSSPAAAWRSCSRHTTRTTRSCARDRVALLHQGRLARLGPPDEVITRESLREVYGVEVTVMEVAGAEGGVARVCVPALGAVGRGARSGRPS